MKKVLLDFRTIETIADMHEYLASQFEFPEYYGMNLDALHDCLTDIDESTCIGVFDSETDSPIADYIARIKRVLRDAEDENEHIGIIFSTPEENYEEEYIY